MNKKKIFEKYLQIGPHMTEIHTFGTTCGGVNDYAFNPFGDTTEHNSQVTEIKIPFICSIEKQNNLYTLTHNPF